MVLSRILNFLHLNYARKFKIWAKLGFWISASILKYYINIVQAQMKGSKRGGFWIKLPIQWAGQKEGGDGRLSPPPPPSKPAFCLFTLWAFTLQNMKQEFNKEKVSHMVVGLTDLKVSLNYYKCLADASYWSSIYTFYEL